MRPVRLALALAFALAAFGAAVYYPAFTRAQPQPPAQRNVSQCGGTITGTLSASEMRLCDPLDVAVRLEPECPKCPYGVNVVYVQVDVAFQAEWMVQESLSSFEQLRGFEKEWPINIGVVHYNSQSVRTVLKMTDNINAARGPLSQPQYGHDPHGDFIGAAQAALEMIREARENENNRDRVPCEFIVFFASTKSIFTEDVNNMKQAGRMIRSDNVELFVGCPENVADYCSATKEMSPNYTEAFERGRVGRMIDRHMDDLETNALTVRDLYLTQFIPSGLAYVEGSANVPPSRQARTLDNRIRLDWEWKNIRSTKPQTVTYSAKPLAEGTWEISGTMKLVDMGRMTRELPMPAKAVTVTGLCLPEPSPTPTGTPEPTATDVPTPTPTDTPEPTATDTPTATPTATSTATPTPTPAPIYLPILLGERCTITWVYTDVVLVLDMSTSMERATGTGRTKLEATLDAAKQFVSMMDLSPDDGGRSDQVGIVGFNAIGWIEQPLTSNGAALAAAIDRLPNGKGQFTRLDLGFELGLEALRPALGRPNTTPVLVLLTDGLPNRVPVDPDGTMETTVRKAAQKAKDAGAKVYTVGIGPPEDINAPLMTQCASVPENYFYTPDSEALAGIYRKIAFSFGCPKGRHDWMQPWP